MQFNAFASKAAINAVIVGTPVMIYNFLLTVGYFQSVIFGFSQIDFSQIDFSLSIFSSQQSERDPQKWISLGPRNHLNLALNKCHENVTICVLKLVVVDCFFVSINVGTGVSLVNIKLLPSSTSNNIKFFRYGFI